MTRRHIAGLIDDNYARQIRLPRDGLDLRTPELVTAGLSIEAKIAARRQWMADRPRASVTELKFGGLAK